MEIDKAYLNEIYMGDVAYACEVFGLFMKYGLEELDQLKRACANQSWCEVRRYAHKVKPSMGMIGFPQLSEELEALELAAQAEDEKEVKKIWTSFMKQFNAVKPKLEAAYALLRAGSATLFGGEANP